MEIIAMLNSSPFWNASTVIVFTVLQNNFLIPNEMCCCFTLVICESWLDKNVVISAIIIFGLYKTVGRNRGGGRKKHHDAAEPARKKKK